MELYYNGQPIRFQARFILEPVGQDWDGTFKPLDELFPNAPDEPLTVEEPKE
jgi:hypothetical protein